MNTPDPEYAAPSRELEQPSSPHVLYLARDEEVEDFSLRPSFTGDVLQLADGRLVGLVQHPCAMAHAQGARLLAAHVVADPKSMRWVGGNYRRMPLPDLMAGRSYSLEFDQLDLVSPDQIQGAKRVSILSHRGVNLLLQRWLHHNSRVIVWTQTIDEQTRGPAEEADLTYEMLDDLISSGMDSSAAARQVDKWFGTCPDAGTRTYRDMLTSPQEQSTVRNAARRYVRTRHSSSEKVSAPVSDPNGENSDVWS